MEDYIERDLPNGASAGEGLFSGKPLFLYFILQEVYFSPFGPSIYCLGIFEPLISCHYDRRDVVFTLT